MQRFLIILLVMVPTCAIGETIEAIAWKSTVFQPGYTRGLYVQVREATLTLGDERIIVICAQDGAGEVIAKAKGTYLAVNGSARKWKNLWIITGGRLVRVIDSN